MNFGSFIISYIMLIILSNKPLILKKRMLNNYYIAQTPYHLMTILNIIYGDINSDYTNVIILAHRSLKRFLPLCKNVKNANTVFDEDLCLNYKVSSVLKHI